MFGSTKVELSTAGSSEAAYHHIEQIVAAQITAGNRLGKHENRAHHRLWQHASRAKHSTVYRAQHGQLPLYMVFSMRDFIEGPNVPRSGAVMHMGHSLGHSETR